ncbi:MAG TPA: WecB/TagA/CpsF family glycosyltransferase [Spirochaetales bacterium]|nr:WecB/TagA/CpsF family glycosyltransferase [Spirochaetales bacterium]HRY54293.1 WecB/TagA/CpsF family glycosyltransferase [Spirochaetia bacterium]
MDSQYELKRSQVLGVPVDILPPDRIEEIASRFEDGKNHQIVLLSLWDLMRARRSGEFRGMVAGASLVLPISRSIIRGARFLRKPEPVRYMPFDFIIALLGALERRGRSVYLLGSSRSVIQKAEVNIKSTFPGLRVVGRYAGRYPKPMEGAIIEAVRKSTPSLLLVGNGTPGRERWIPRNLSRFNAGLYLWCSDLFEVFAKRHGKPSRELFDRGLEWLPYLLRRPWKAYRIFVFLWYEILLLAARLRGD